MVEGPPNQGRGRLRPPNF